ncbi:asparaginase [Saccharopolyspora erythraea]|uniref:asparaginase n=1 Tax=Saccharopolyspora erythraea TaxID=1836 RepID=UPI001BEFBEB6|nr:asparaginase [Saccharopolyspora erythraea]QUH01893.1 asparaginase [Saccharopolyspora erythraea]
MESAARIRIIALGGTIASTTGANGRARPRLTGDQLLTAVPGLDQVAALEVDSLDPVPSCSIGWAQVLEVADRIERARQAGLDGVVITQGTDTIEETSFAWDLLSANGMAVVVTGAMRHSDHPGADGPANLLDAVRLAATPAARSHGVLVTLASEIHTARTVRKRHTSSIAAFTSPTGSVGEIVEDRVHLAPPDSRHVLLTAPTHPAEIPRIPLVRACLGDGGWWLTAAQAAPGVVIEGMGGGHLPIAEAMRLREFAHRMPVVLTSRTGAGDVLRQTYGGFTGSETDLLDAGLIPAGDLDGMKARVALSLALALDMPREEISSTFEVLGTGRETLSGAVS